MANFKVFKSLLFNLRRRISFWQLFWLDKHLFSLSKNVDHHSHVSGSRNLKPAFHSGQNVTMLSLYFLNFLNAGKVFCFSPVVRADESLELLGKSHIFLNHLLQRGIVFMIYHRVGEVWVNTIVFMEYLNHQVMISYSTARLNLNTRWKKLANLKPHKIFVC